MGLYPYNSDEGQTDLMAAAFNGDADEVARLLVCPCDVDAQDAHGVTALMYAAIEGHVEVLSRLLDAGADLELEAKQRYTALMYAAREHLDCVELLLRAKADPNVHGSYDMLDTPLIIAARQGQFGIVRVLVKSGADVGIYGGIAGITEECAARHAGHHAISEFLCYNEKPVKGESVDQQN